MRRVRTAGHVIEKERLVWCGCVQFFYVLDSFIRQIGGQVVAGTSNPRGNGGVVSEQKGLPLVGLAAHEPVEVLKPHSARPLVERSGQAVEIGRGVMVFAKPA